MKPEMQPSSIHRRKGSIHVTGSHVKGISRNSAYTPWWQRVGSDGEPRMRCRIFILSLQARVIFGGFSLSPCGLRPDSQEVQPLRGNPYYIRADRDRTVHLLVEPV
jgi:hypothetical protein